MRMTRIWGSLVFLTVVLSACADATATRPVYKRLAGRLSVNPEVPPQVTVPSEGVAGVPVQITVLTMGGGCVNRGDTEASVAGLTADVTPYDSFVVSLPPNMACTLELRYLTHATTVTFSAPGAAVVRIHGRPASGDGLITVERTIQIR